MLAEIRCIRGRSTVRSGISSDHPDFVPGADYDKLPTTKESGDDQEEDVDNVEEDPDFVVDNDAVRSEGEITSSSEEIPAPPTTPRHHAAPVNTIPGTPSAAQIRMLIATRLSNNQIDAFIEAGTPAAPCCAPRAEPGRPASAPPSTPRH